MQTIRNSVKLNLLFSRYSTNTMLDFSVRIATGHTSTHRNRGEYLHWAYSLCWPKWIFMEQRENRWRSFAGVERCVGCIPCMREATAETAAQRTQLSGYLFVSTRHLVHWPEYNALAIYRYGTCAGPGSVAQACCSRGSPFIFGSDGKLNCLHILLCTVARLRS